MTPLLFYTPLFRLSFILLAICRISVGEGSNPFSVTMLTNTKLSIMWKHDRPPENLSLCTYDDDQKKPVHFADPSIRTENYTIYVIDFDNFPVKYADPSSPLDLEPCADSSVYISCGPRPHTPFGVKLSRLDVTGLSLGWEYDATKSGAEIIFHLAIVDADTNEVLADDSRVVEAQTAESRFSHFFKFTEKMPLLANNVYRAIVTAEVHHVISPPVLKLITMPQIIPTKPPASSFIFNLKPENIDFIKTHHTAKVSIVDDQNVDFLGPRLSYAVAVHVGNVTGRVQATKMVESSRNKAAIVLEVEKLRPDTDYWVVITVLFDGRPVLREGEVPLAVMIHTDDTPSTLPPTTTTTTKAKTTTKRTTTLSTAPPTRPPTTTTTTTTTTTAPTTTLPDFSFSNENIQFFEYKTTSVQYRLLHLPAAPFTYVVSVTDQYGVNLGDTDGGYNSFTHENLPEWTMVQKLKPSTEYIVKIDLFSSSWSRLSTFRTRFITLPFPVSGVKAELEEGSVAVSWTDYNNQHESIYYIFPVSDSGVKIDPPINTKEKKIVIPELDIYQNWSISVFVAGQGSTGLSEGVSTLFVAQKIREEKVEEEKVVEVAKVAALPAIADLRVVCRTENTALVSWTYPTDDQSFQIIVYDTATNTELDILTTGFTNVVIGEEDDSCDSSTSTPDWFYSVVPRAEEFYITLSTIVLNKANEKIASSPLSKLDLRAGAVGTEMVADPDSTDLHTRALNTKTTLRWAPPTPPPNVPVPVVNIGKASSVTWIVDISHTGPGVKYYCWLVPGQAEQCEVPATDHYIKQLKTGVMNTVTFYCKNAAGTTGDVVTASDTTRPMIPQKVRTSYEREKRILQVGWRSGGGGQDGFIVRLMSCDDLGRGCRKTSEKTLKTPVARRKRAASLSHEYTLMFILEKSRFEEYFKALVFAVAGSRISKNSTSPLTTIPAFGTIAEPHTTPLPGSKSTEAPHIHEASSYPAPDPDPTTSPSYIVPEVEAIREDDQTGMALSILLGICAALLVGSFFILAIFLQRKYRKKGSEPEFTFTSPTRKALDQQQFMLSPRVSAIAVKDFLRHVEKLAEDNFAGFHREYVDLRTAGVDKTATAAERPENRRKNRYGNIVAYDHSRVLLSVEGGAGSDYINANYIPGIDSKRAYIATQAPLEGTAEDFWRMVIEQRSSTIVCIIHPEEVNSTKFFPYWCPLTGLPGESRSRKRRRNPDDISVTFGSITITTVQEVEFGENYAIQTLVKRRGICYDVTIFLYVTWLDMGSELNLTNLVSFADQMRTVAANTKGEPIVVHCSAGVGRTGTFIAVDRCVHDARHRKFVDVLGTVREMREHRPQMVQTVEQYAMIHFAVTKALETDFNTSFTSGVRSMYSTVGRNSVYTNPTGARTVNQQLPRFYSPSKEAPFYIQN